MYGGCLLCPFYPLLVLTVSCIVTQFGRENFWICCFRGSCMREWTNPRVLKITVTHAVCKWRCWTLPLLWFEREKMQLVYEIILLKKILSENLQWNYASFINVTLIYLMPAKEFCVTSSLALNNWVQKYCQNLGNKPNPSIPVTVEPQSLIRTPKGQSEVSVLRRCPNKIGHYDDVTFVTPLTVLSVQ